MYLMFSRADTLEQMQGSGTIIRLSEVCKVKPDKILHALLFIPIVPLTWLAFRPQWAVTKVMLLWAGVFFGLLTEGIQHYISYRTGDLADVAADVVGSVLGMPFILLSYVFYKKGKHGI